MLSGHNFVSIYICIPTFLLVSLYILLYFSQYRGFWWESHKEIDLDMGGRIILKSILEKLDGVVWTGFIWL
jgi:hypothetical protein